MLIDTHAHLMDAAFDQDREKVISDQFSDGVERIIEVACDPKGFDAARELAMSHDGIYAAFGIHPEYVFEYTAADLERLRAVLSYEKAVALGEIGLDYHYEPVDREGQMTLFERQLVMAKELDMPVSLHVRDAYGDCMEILRRHREGLKGVMHCFSGSAEIARECVAMGLYIAFGGSLTFKNNRRGVEACAAVPLERLLLETDCPYMAPTPHRGKRCEPRMTRLTAGRMADIKGVDVEEIISVTTANARRLFFKEE